MKQPGKRDFHNRSMWRIFLSYFRPHRGLFLLDMGCAAVVALIDLAFPLVSRAAMYDLLPEHLFGAFFAVMGALAAAYLLRSCLNYVITYWGHTFGIRVEADIRSELFAHMQKLGFDFYDANRTGSLMSRLTTDLFDISELAHHGPEDLLLSLATIAGALIVMYSIEWRLAIVVTVLLPIAVAVMVWRRRGMARASLLVKQKTAGINTDIESGLSGMRTSKAFANETVEQAKFEASNTRFKTSKKLFHREMGLFTASMEFFVTILPVGVITAGGVLIMQDKLTYIDLITFNLYITAFTSPIRKLAMFAELFSSGSAGLGRFVELMRTEPTLSDAPDAVELERAAGRIDVDRVAFAYEHDPDVLHNVSLHIRQGETVAIVGPSGGGKSTLCQLIPRFYEVSEGSISVDGLDVRSITQASLRRNVGIVQQDVFLFADTIYENIRYGRPDATREEIVEAAKRAELYDDIMAMPNGFDTYVGERGTLLSGGQKQRVSIARVFLKDPPILILDEATSALDSVTEAKIQSAFDELARGRTTLIIAHRLSTIRSAHRIVVICDGVVAEQGTHKELLSQNGVYAQLYRTQNDLPG